MLRSFRIALIQIGVTANKAHNLANTTRMVREAARNGAHVVVLPVPMQISCQKRSTSH
jgi:predicted amidohydrolase